MKSMPLTYLEMELLIDALKIQANSGHLNSFLQGNADKLQEVITKLSKS